MYLHGHRAPSGTVTAHTIECAHGPAQRPGPPEQVGAAHPCNRAPAAHTRAEPGEWEGSNNPAFADKNNIQGVDIPDYVFLQPRIGFKAIHSIFKMYTVYPWRVA